MAADDTKVEAGNGLETVTGIRVGLWTGRGSGTPLEAEREVMVGEGAVATSATVRDESWLGAETEMELEAGSRTGDGTGTGLADDTDALAGHVVGSGDGAELEAAADAGDGEMTGAAGGF